MLSIMFHKTKVLKAGRFDMTVSGSERALHCLVSEYIVLEIQYRVRLEMERRKRVKRACPNWCHVTLRLPGQHDTVGKVKADLLHDFRRNLLMKRALE